MKTVDFTKLTPPLVEEIEAVLYVDGRKYQSFLCTPESLKELAVGHLYVRGEIDSEDQVSGIQILNMTEGDLVRYQICLELKDRESRIRQSGKSITLPLLSELQSCADQVQNLASKYKSHGGIHCAALYDGSSIVALNEDVGRHNAFDKAIGKVICQGIDPSRLIYFSSGRINSEIAEKAAASGLALLISRSIATTRACLIAHRSDMGIVGRIDSNDPIIYTTSTRI